MDLAEERDDQRIKEDKGEIMAGIINLLSKSEEYVDDNMKFYQYVCDIVKNLSKRMWIKIINSQTINFN